MVNINEDDKKPDDLEDPEDSEASDDGEKDSATGIKAWFFKDGKFSKTAAFATIGNFAVLFTWFFQVWFGGVTIDTNHIHYTIPNFNDESAMIIMGFLNGAYLGNNLIKKK